MGRLKVPNSLSREDDEKLCADAATGLPGLHFLTLHLTLQSDILQYFYPVCWFNQFSADDGKMNKTESYRSSEAAAYGMQDSTSVMIYNCRSHECKKNIDFLHSYLLLHVDVSL